MNRLSLLIFSLVLFTICLAVPAVEFERICSSNASDLAVGLWNEPYGRPEVTWGISMFLEGGLGVILLQHGAVGWLANPMYLLAIIASLDKHWIVARVAIVAALSFALVSLHLTNWFPLVADAGGVCYKSATQPLWGHWLWLSAMGVLTIHLWLRQKPAPRKSSRC